MSNNKNVLFLREEYGNGQGTYIYPNGEKYEGDWKNGKYHGHGTYSWSNGNKYVGEWKDDEEWNITEYDKEGTIIGKIVNGVKK